MAYDSTINFTLDTICPWTYIAKKRLGKALEIVRAENPPVTFTITYLPFQLYPSFSDTGEDKYAWYKKSKYADSQEQMDKYTTVMTALGADIGITFRFGGTIANTLQAHRVVQAVQERHGAQMTDRLVDALYVAYFEREMHPASEETLKTALSEAGVEESEATELVVDRSEGLMVTKMAIREQGANGVDSVPYIIIEGRRRDFTLEGAREVDEYVKTLKQVIKEAA